jgi:hypothetical protein
MNLAPIGGSVAPATIGGTSIVYTASGGGLSTSLPNISNWKDPMLFATIVIAVTIVDTIVLFFTRYFPDTLGEPLNKWYDQFQLSAVVSDVGIIVIGFVLAQLIYTQFFAPTHGWNVWIFLAVLVGVQLLHDLFFYFAVIQPIPKGHNEMMDVMKSYTKGAGSMILVGDALLMLASAAVAMALKDQSIPTLLFAGLGAAYTIPYILTTRWETNSTKKPKKEAVDPSPIPLPPRQEPSQGPSQPVRQQSQEQQMDHRSMSFGQDQGAYRTGTPAPPFANDMPAEPIASNFYY